MPTDPIQRPYVEPSKAAMDAADEISRAWRWDIRYEEIGAIIDRHVPPAPVAKVADYERLLCAIRDGLYQDPGACATEVDHMLEKWGVKR